MDTEKIEIHTDALNHRIIEELDGMRPKVDPIPAAKGRAIVIGTASAGLALVIATAAMAWSSFEDIKRKDLAMAAKIEADKVKANHEASISLLKAQAEADAIRGRSEQQAASMEGGGQVASLPNLSLLPVDLTSTGGAGGGDRTDIRTTVTVFKEKTFAGGTVMTGWDFPNSSSPRPSWQFCYFTRATGQASSDRLDLATDKGPQEFLTQDLAKVGLSEEQVLEARRHCEWFDGSSREVDGEAIRQSQAVPSCTEAAIRLDEEHLSKPMRFCLGGSRRLVAFGEFVDGTYQEFRRALGQSAVTTIVLNSPGGVVYEARQMAELIRARQLNTHTLSQCNSACIATMSAGIVRTANNEASFGLHRPVWEQSERITREDIDSYRTSSRALYVAHGVDPRLEEIEWAVPNTDLKSISVDEAREYNLING